jgi:uncharacterized membrane protein
LVLGLVYALPLIEVLAMTVVSLLLRSVTNNGANPFLDHVVHLVDDVLVHANKSELLTNYHEREEQRERHVHQ